MIFNAGLHFVSFTIEQSGYKMKRIGLQRERISGAIDPIDCYCYIHGGNAQQLSRYFAWKAHGLCAKRIFKNVILARGKFPRISFGERIPPSNFRINFRTVTVRSNLPDPLNHPVSRSRVELGRHRLLTRYVIDNAQWQVAPSSPFASLNRCARARGECINAKFHSYM